MAKAQYFEAQPYAALPYGARVDDYKKISGTYYKIATGVITKSFRGGHTQ